MVVECTRVRQAGARRGARNNTRPRHVASSVILLDAACISLKERLHFCVRLPLVRREPRRWRAETTRRRAAKGTRETRSSIRAACRAVM
jgi:hypothetical protein